MSGAVCRVANNFEYTRTSRSVLAQCHTCTHNVCLTKALVVRVWLAECPDWVPKSIIEEATWDIPLHVRLSESLTSHYRLYSSYVDYAHQPFMRYRFRIERRLGFYLVNLVLPMFLIVGTIPLAYIFVLENLTSPTWPRSQLQSAVRWVSFYIQIYKEIDSEFQIKKRS